MHILNLKRQKIELIPLLTEIRLEAGEMALRSKEIDDPAGRLSSAAWAFFGLTGRGRMATTTEIKKEPPVGVFREKKSGLLRMVHKEIVVRFAENTLIRTRKKIFEKMGVTARARNGFVRSQYVIKCKRKRKRTGSDLLDLAAALMDLEEVEFATPNFVSEYRRTAIPVEQWHLKNTAAVSGQKPGEDVDAEGAWKITRGKSGIVVAVLDDGVDIDHPNLRAQIQKNPDATEPRDKFGRDFFIPDDTDPEHFDPRPKRFQFPFHRMPGNDIHGTPCAGVIAARGNSNSSIGIAPGCKLLPVKVFHADNLASDARVADAIRYAIFNASVLSCSWSSGTSTDVEMAINVDADLGREGKGTPIFCAAGNGGGRPVSFPARLSGAMAVGASTDKAELANYSNVGKEIWIVAPSSGGKRGIYTTDVAIDHRGFNVGNDAQGGADGLNTNDFGGTSSATPLAAGVAALMLSVNPDLTRAQVQQILADTAEKIGTGYNSKGHSSKFGFGRVDAARAVAAAKALR